MESVVGQTYPRIEYLIVDGGSTDETLHILGRYRRKLSKVINEQDRGISDAFNKGVNASSGDFIQLLNADDYLAQDKIEKSVMRLQAHPSAGFVFGDIIRIGVNGTQKRIMGDPHFRRWIRFTMGRLNHPTVLAERNLFERYGLFDERWSTAMDYEWLLRVYNEGIRGIYSPNVITYMGAGGKSEAGAYTAFREVRDISILHGFNSVAAYGYYALRAVKHFVYLKAGLR